MPQPEDLQSAGLDAWDWRKALELHPIGRYGGLTWLAEATGTKRATVYSYSGGRRNPPITWLRKAAQALGHEGIGRGANR